jgi:hypothetical protein
LILLLACAQAFAAQGGPDLYGYTWIDSTEVGGPTYDYEFGALEHEDVGDDAFLTVDIGFTFVFVEQEFTQIDVHSNGALSFGGGGPIGHDHDCAALVPDVQGTNDPLDVPVLLPYWMDLDPTDVSNGAIYTGTVGIEPNRILIVEWFEIPPYGDDSHVTFEAKLYEADGAIEFHYSNLDASDDEKDNGKAAAIGTSVDASHYFAVSCNSEAIVGPGIAVRIEPPGCADEDTDGVTVCDGDCDDTDPLVHPGADEICNGEDEDCDGLVPPDEVDLDGDSWMGCEGDCNDSDETLNLDDADGDGQNTCEGDCDDSDPDRSDEDVDGDGESGCDGDCDDTDPLLNDLDEDEDGYSTCGGDCDDDNGVVRPDASELCDGLDNDCDGDIDENPNCGDDDDAADDDDDDDPEGWDIPYGCIMNCDQGRASGNGSAALALVLLLAAGCTVRRSRRQ